MATYQVRFLGPDGRVGKVRAIECDGDDEALERLAKLNHRGPLELWREDRLIWRFEARFTL